MNALKKTWIWLCRFRNRKGYGVHSPFAYNLIRNVINEKGEYYAYADLKPLRKNARSLSPLKVDKLLFRLANFFQPSTAIQVGTGGALSLKYVQAGCKRTHCMAMPDTRSLVSHWKEQAALQKSEPLGLLYICETDDFQEIFESALPFVDEHTLIIVDNPYAGKARRQWWHELENDSRVGLTFDLYELGIVLFDFTYYKQHYRVNFM